jgi:hypothetical protein
MLGFLSTHGIIDRIRCVKMVQERKRAWKDRNKLQPIRLAANADGLADGNGFLKGELRGGD